MVGSVRSLTKEWFEFAFVKIRTGLGRLALGLHLTRPTSTGLAPLPSTWQAISVFNLSSHFKLGL